MRCPLTLAPPSGSRDQHLIAMGGNTNRSLAMMFINLVQASATQQWVAFVRNAHVDALNLQQTFTIAEHSTTNLMVLRGNIVSTACDPSSVAQDLPPMIHTDVTPPLESTTTARRGVQYVAASLRKLAEWRKFFNMHDDVHTSIY